MTHLNATFIVIATDGENAYFGLSENGESAVDNYAVRLDAISSLLRYEVRECIVADRPLVVVVGKNKPRATAGEVFLKDFALAVVRKAVAEIPAELHVFIGGEALLAVDPYYAPRVTSIDLPWATKSSPMRNRICSLLDGLSSGDEGIVLLPARQTYVEA